MAKTKIGGQAVMEGVMMRGATSMALAVRDESGVVRIEATRTPKKRAINKIPFLRGVVNLIQSLVMGMTTLEKSAEVLGEDEVSTDDGKGLKVALVFSMLIGLVIALVLFVMLPSYLPKWINSIFSIEMHPMWVITVQEIAKIAIIIGYFLLVSKNKEISRIFMYHGAEHKTINCFEAELPLTVENVQKSSKHHDRCGTSFVVYVFVLSVFVVFCASMIFSAVNFHAYFDLAWVRFLINLAFVPVVAGISYEVLMALAKTNGKFWSPLKNLGKLMQRITTKEPDDSMCEVAIAAFNKVLEMDANPDMPPQYFPKPVSFEDFKQHISQLLTKYDLDSQNLEWAVNGLLKLKEGTDTTNLKIGFFWLAKADKIFEEISKGMPLQYGIGTAPFFEYFLYVDKNVLIPRQETQLLAEEVIKANPNTVLDLCCGSGCIGLTVAKKTSAKVCLCDISKPAIKVAKQNAKLLAVTNAKFVCSNMFDKIKGKFDIIVCNPPYIKSDIIDTLDTSVKDFEPKIALDGGETGLDYYKTLVSQADKYLTDNGKLFVEIGYDQGKEVCDLFAEKYTTVLKKDYSGNDRMVLATKK